jgi:hypothetical protein
MKITQQEIHIQNEPNGLVAKAPTETTRIMVTEMKNDNQKLKQTDYL